MKLLTSMYTIQAKYASHLASNKKLEEHFCEKDFKANDVTYIIFQHQEDENIIWIEFMRYWDELDREYSREDWHLLKEDAVSVAWILPQAHKAQPNPIRP